MFPELFLRLCQPFRRDGHLPPLGFLVHQFFELDHLERAAADVRFHGAREARVVLLGIRENGVHLAEQVNFGEHGPIDTRDRPGQGLHPVATGCCRRQIQGLCVSSLPPRRRRGCQSQPCQQHQGHCQNSGDACAAAVHDPSHFRLDSGSARCLQPAAEQALRNASPRGRKVSSSRKEGTYCVGTVIRPCASLDSPPWQVRQNCAALLLVVLFPGSYQPRTKKCVGLITAAVVVVPATAMNWVMSCWSWQVVQVTHELLVYDVYGAVPTPVPGTLTRFAIGPVLVTS